MLTKYKLIISPLYAVLAHKMTTLSSSPSFSQRTSPAASAHSDPASHYKKKKKKKHSRCVQSKGERKNSKIIKTHAPFFLFFSTAISESAMPNKAASQTKSRVNFISIHLGDVEGSTLMHNARP